VWHPDREVAAPPPKPTTNNPAEIKQFFARFMSAN
jgi:hypothetical protein